MNRVKRYIKANKAWERLLRILTTSVNSKQVCLVLLFTFWLQDELETWNTALCNLPTFGILSKWN